MNPGSLDQRVFLLRKVQTPDGAGGVTVAWTPYDVVWAAFKPMSGRELAARGRTEASQMYTVTVRNRDDVLDSDAIRWKGRSLNIRAVKNRGPGPVELEIEAEIGVLV